MSSPDGIVSPIIWTPRFIVLFVSLLASGLSVASVLIQLSLNGVLSAGAVLLFYTAFALGSSLFLTLKTQNLWVRAGGIFACIWSLLMGLHFSIPMVSQLDAHTTLVSHLDIATQCAFLGTAACFSVSSTPLRRWDNWFFCLLPLVAAAIVELNMLFTPTDLPAGSFSESMIVTALLYLGLIIWWFRPANWRARPDATLLAGTIPLLQLLFTASGYQLNSVTFFIALVILLCFFLFNLRLLQGEQCLFNRRVKPELHEGSQ
jgi:hypothetical protein